MRWSGWRLPQRHTWLAVLIFTALTLLLAYPLSLHPATLRFPTGPDGDLGWYLLGWNTHALFTKPWAIFDANIYYPNRLTLAYGENIIGLAFFAAPVIWLTDNLLLAANFVSITSCILCGLGAYVLGRRVGLSVAAAVIAGIIFECAPPRFFRIGQVNLSSVQWIPFGLAALHAYFDAGRRSGLVLAAACVCIQALSSGHGAVFMAATLLIFALYRLLLAEPLRPVKWIRDLGVTGAVLLALPVLVFLPYRAVQHEVGLKRGLGTWIANNESFFASPSHLHRFLLDAVGLEGINARAEAFLFPGFLAIVFGLAAFDWRRGGRLAWEWRRPAAWWSALAVGAEAAMIAVAAVAAVLTAATLIPLRGGAMRLADLHAARVGWIVCASGAAAGLAARWWLPRHIVARHQRPLLLLLAAAFGWILLTAGRPMLRAGDGMVAEYFTNVEWTGPPAFTVVDPRPSDAIATGRWPRGAPRQFSVRWFGFLSVPRAGVYHFATRSDDGSELMVDNRLIVDNRGAHSAATVRGSIRLDQGSHLVVLRYVQYGGDTALNWSWSDDGVRYAAVPAWALSERPAGLVTVIAARIMDAAVWVLAALVVLAAAWYVRAALAGREALRQWADARRRDATTFYALLTLMMLWLALGPPYGLWQYVYSLPGFNFIRANTRFTLVALLGIAVLAGMGFDRIARRLPRRSRLLLATAAAAVLVAEYAAMPMASQPARVDIPAVDRWLDGRPKPFVVAEVPVHNAETQLGRFERQEATYMIHSTAHWQKTVHGYSGWRSSLHHQLYSEMQTFPDETSVNALLNLGVTYVVVHTELYAPDEWSRLEKRLEQFSPRLRLEHVEGTGRVYSLHTPPG